MLSSLSLSLSLGIIIPALPTELPIVLLSGASEPHGASSIMLPILDFLCGIIIPPLCIVITGDESGELCCSATVE